MTTATLPTTGTATEDQTSPPKPDAIDPALCDRTQADMDLQRQQKAAWDAYYGKFRDSVDVEPNKRNRNVKSNRCAAIVDKGAGWLAGKGLEIEVADKDAPEQDPKAKKKTDAQPAPKDDRQIWLEKFLGNADKFKTKFTEVCQMGGVTGHAFVKLVYDETKNQKMPRYVLLDSQNVYVRTDPEDCDIPVVYVVEYEIPIMIAKAGGQPQTLVKRQIMCRVAPDGTPRYGQMDADGNLPATVGDYDDENDYWTIAEYIRPKTAGVTGGSWKLLGDSVIDWNYPFAPIVDCMNLPAPNQYYGLSDLPPEIVALNEKVNDVQTDTATILEVYSMPIPYATGFGNVATIRVPAGELLTVPQGGDAGVLQPRGDIASNRDFANDLRADMDEQSRVPAVALGRQESLPKGNISGIALSLMFQPLIEKTELKRALYGPMLQELCLRAMVIAGVCDYDTTEVRLHWGELLPKDDAATAQMATAMKAAGMSDHAICEVFGLDWEEEQEYKREEQEAQLTAFSRGQALPPVDGSMLDMPMPADGTPAPAQDATAASNAPGQPAASQPPANNQPPINSPAARAARQRMQAANGKPVTPNGM